MGRIVIGTRGSALALWQARHVAELLKARHPGIEVAEQIVQSEGDLDGESAIPDLGTIGVFVRRLEHALLAREIDLAVHSLKDLPVDQPTGIVVAAVPERHDPRDALVSTGGWTLEDIPPGTHVGTGSLRRRSQLLHQRPDLAVDPIRGNVDTRVRRLREGRCGALVLALAGLERLGVEGVAFRPLDPGVCIPAAGQGALAIEARMDDRRARETAGVLTHEPTLAAVTAERSFLRRLGGGCQAPAGAYARFEDGRLVVEGVVGDPQGRAMLVERESGVRERAHAIGARLAERLLVAGARQLLASARSTSSRADG